MSLLLPVARKALSLLPDAVPKRQRRLAGRRAVVDGVPFVMPVNSADTPALMAAFPVDADAAAAILPGGELHPVRLPGNKTLLVATIVNYISTDIGSYIEYSLALTCTHGRRPAPPLLPGLLRGTFGTGQYVVDLPVSSEISVRGGKGIWGMPKHQANLDFVVTDETVSSQYDKDGVFACKVEIERPSPTALPLKVGAANYCSFRGMLMKSYIYFAGNADVAFGKRARATISFGDAPGVAPLRNLDIGDALFTAYLPNTHGVLDDHFEAWFLTGEQAPPPGGDDLHSVIDLTLSQEWLEPPSAPAPLPRWT